MGLPAVLGRIIKTSYHKRLKSTAPCTPAGSLLVRARTSVLRAAEGPTTDLAQQRDTGLHSMELNDFPATYLNGARLITSNGFTN